MVRYEMILVLCIFSQAVTCHGQGAGIALKYPHDAGIENDPAVVFTENFEEAALADVLARWDDVSNSAGMSFAADVPAASGGARSLQMTSELGQNTGGHLYKMLPQGYDALYARFYVKLAADCHPVHHFVHMGGYNPPTRWPQGGAGIRPDGTDRFTTGIEPMGAGWRWDFYTYWMHMRGNPGGPQYWGNDFNPAPPMPVERGRWMSVEFMIRVNAPLDAYNGEQTFWIDGVEGIRLGEALPNGYWVWDSFFPDAGSPPFEGFQWRIADALRVNFFWLLFYMTGGNPGQVDSVLFDDIVIATDYIGPLFVPAANVVLFGQRTGSDVLLTWSSSNPAGYTLTRSLDEVFSTETTLYSGPSTQATDTGAATDPNDFYYRVR